MRTTAAVLDEPIDSSDFAETEPATIEEITVIEPVREEVLVEITAASLCHTDVASARGHFEEACPCVMGHEGAGVVRAVGDDVKSVEPDDPVVLGRITCGRCEYCRAGKGQHCVERTEARQRGTLRTGDVRFARDGDPVHHYHGVSSFTEHTVVTEEVAIPVPEKLPPEQATLLGCGVFTGVGAVMNTADVEAASSVVIFGAGGVGLSAIQGARIRGATTIVAVDIISEKLDRAADVGATHTIDSSALENPVAEICDICNGGADYAFEVVGNKQVAQQAVEVLAPTGQAVLVGVPPSGPRDLELNLNEVVLDEKTMRGSFNGSYSLPLAIPQLAELAVTDNLLLKPLVTDEKPLDRLNKAMRELESGSGVRQIIRP